MKKYKWTKKVELFYFFVMNILYFKKDWQNLFATSRQLKFVAITTTLLNAAVNFPCNVCVSQKGKPAPIQICLSPRKCVRSYFMSLFDQFFFLVNAEECGVNYFKCKKNGKCILGAFHCDGEFDCYDDDKSDEESCEGIFFMSNVIIY